MSVEHKPLGHNRYRESFGRHFEDFKVGDVYEHRPGRTISEADNTWFTLLTMNTHPLHFDAEYAAKTEFGKPLVNSCLTLAMVAGMSVSDLSQKAVANLGWDKVRLTAPVFAGDTIEIAPDTGHSHRAHHRQESRWHRVHELRARDPGAQARPRGG
jgi:itaconyl-CoA hydratase